MTQTGSPQANVTSQGIFYLFVFPQSVDPEALTCSTFRRSPAHTLDTVFYRIDGWERADYLCHMLAKMGQDQPVAYACAPASIFPPRMQTLLHRKSTDIREMAANLNPALQSMFFSQQALPEWDGLFHLVHGCRKARDIEEHIRVNPDFMTTGRNPPPQVPQGDPLNLMLNRLHLHADLYCRVLKAVADWPADQCDSRLDLTCQISFQAMKEMLEQGDDLQDAGITGAPWVEVLGSGPHWQEVVKEAGQFFVKMDRYVKGRGMYDPPPGSAEAKALAPERAEALKNIERAMAHGKPAHDTQTAGLLATLNARFEEIKEDRIKAVLREQEKQKTIEELAERPEAFLAGLASRLTDKERSLFLLLTGYVKEGTQRRNLSFAEIGRKLGGITKQAVQCRMRALYKKYPVVANYVEAVRSPGKTQKFSEMSPSERRKLGVDESYN